MKREGRIEDEGILGGNVNQSTVSMDLRTVRIVESVQSKKESIVIAAAPAPPSDQNNDDKDHFLREIFDFCWVPVMVILSTYLILSFFNSLNIYL